MLLDSQNLFSENQSITTGTINSTNDVRFGVGDISFVPVLVQVTNTFSDLTSLTLKVVTSATSDFSTSVELASLTLLKASLIAGNKFPISFFPQGNLGYVRLTYTVAGTTETTGKITAGVVASNEFGWQDL